MSGTQSSYLKKFIDEKENNGNKASQTRDNEPDDKVTDLGSVSELKFMPINTEEMPCKWFYPAGTTVFIRPADVEEIQAFSVVDDSNFYDIFDKVNYMISKCVYMKEPDGTRRSHKYIVDGDRWYLLFAIRDLTFQKGNDLLTKADGSDVQIPIKRGNFKFHEMSDKIAKYYDKVNGVFNVKTKIGDFTLAPPTLGVQKSFSDYVLKNIKSGAAPDQSFLKIVPYTLPHRTSVTEEGIKKYINEYKNMSKEEFQFLNQIVDIMKFGIKGVYSFDESGEEVHSTNVFPTGISGLFVESDTIDDYLI